MSTNISRSPKPRRGMAIVVVLGLLAVTMALSYALLRTQGMDHQLERNTFRTRDAQSAAQVGMSVALRKMHDGTWSSADSTFTEQVAGNSLQGYTITYSTGDSSLTSSSPSYSEYPYRVTILCTGYAIDPVTATSRSEYKIRAVAQLVRKKLNATQASVSNLDSFSFYQTANSTVRVHHPMRLNGNVMLQGSLTYCDQYPLSVRGSAYNRYMDDLYAMKTAGVGDYRTFGGTVYTPSSRQSSNGDFVQVVRGRLQTPWVNVSTSSTSPVSVPASISSYKLYSGGKSYSPQTLSFDTDLLNLYPNKNLLPSTTYGANPLTNPLSVYTTSSKGFTMKSGTTFNGLILSTNTTGNSDIYIYGSNITFSSPSLPALDGDSTTYRLPALLSQTSVRLDDGTNRSITGMIVTTDEFQVLPGLSSTSVTMNGPVICSRLYLDYRNAWQGSSTLWTLYYTNFNVANVLFNLYFPKWLGETQFALGYFLDPKLVFNPSATGVKTHVPDWSQPIFVADPSDGGLVWKVVSWQQPY